MNLLSGELFKGGIKFYEVKLFYLRYIQSSSSRVHKTTQICFILVKFVENSIICNFYILNYKFSSTHYWAVFKVRINRTISIYRYII